MDSIFQQNCKACFFKHAIFGLIAILVCEIACLCCAVAASLRQNDLTHAQDDDAKELFDLCHLNMLHLVNGVLRRR